MLPERVGGAHARPAPGSAARSGFGNPVGPEPRVWIASHPRTPVFAAPAGRDTPRDGPVHSGVARLTLKSNIHSHEGVAWDPAC
ncbi:hypothetical protein GCM10010249_15660 [Streptomyces roseolilacinus]|uniref:Uncharacterized protein n=1 Tax=Streptomyces roseolilacinus TaxID=66904 RepID=A0A918AXU6_9ACTN|nr:hypothetical protein GCM10010249_15660 [Streptomyces roseolilacinus]